MDFLMGIVYTLLMASIAMILATDLLADRIRKMGKEEEVNRNAETLGK